MRYIKKYICSLSSDVKVSESSKSNSVYIVLDGGFRIRLSDHESANPHSGMKMDIMSIWRSDNFLLFMGNSHIPLVKNRTQLKEHIRVTYENWALEHYKNLSDMLNTKKEKEKEKNDDVQQPINLRDCKKIEDFQAYIDEKYNERFPFDGPKCSVILGNLNPSISKKVRSYLSKVVDNNINDGALVLFIVKKYGTRLTSWQVVDDVIARHRNNNEEKGH